MRRRLNQFAFKSNNKDMIPNGNRQARVGQLDKPCKLLLLRIPTTVFYRGNYKKREKVSRHVECKAQVFEEITEKQRHSQPD